MSETYAEIVIQKMVQKNTTVLGTKACEAISISGPLRLANRNPRALIELAMTALAGQATKEIVKAVVPVVPANFTISMTSANRYVALLIRVAGSKYGFKQADVLLTVAGTGMTDTKVALSPLSNKAELMVLLTSNNAGVGSIAAPTAVTVTWALADHPEAAGNEYAVMVESISLRDFTSREI